MDFWTGEISKLERWDIYLLSADIESKTNMITNDEGIIDLQKQIILCEQNPLTYINIGTDLIFTHILTLKFTFDLFKNYLSNYPTNEIVYNRLFKYLNQYGADYEKINKDLGEFIEDNKYDKALGLVLKLQP